MAAQERREFHWVENRIVESIVDRPERTDQWRFDKHTRTLVATIEEHDRSFYLREGPAALPERIVDSIRLYKGVLTDDSISDYSGAMPESIRSELRSKLNEVTNSILPQWSSFAEEPDISGYIKGKLDGILVERDGWRVRVKAWTYKRRPKERDMGADLGIVFDVTYKGQRLIKASWYQAKIDKGLPLNEVEDLSEQVRKMQDYTREAYTLLYSADEIIAVRGMDRNDSSSLSENLVEGVICRRGDRNPLVVANTVDIKHVVTFFVSANPA